MAGVLENNLKRVRLEIETASKQSQDVARNIRIVAVSKRQSIEKIRQLYGLSLIHISEPTRPY